MPVSRSTMKLRHVAALLAIAPLLGCPPDDGGGGAGGGGSITFNEGFAFIRRDDRNVYVADKSDFTKVAKLTTAGNARQPAISKDGKRVVYVENTGVRALVAA
jgi:TolB protein